MHKILLSILAFAAAAIASPTVFFIRHGEKPKHGGVGLSIDGLERAQCVRDIFGPHSDYNIDYILAQKPKSSMHSPEGSHYYTNERWLTISDKMASEHDHTTP